MTTIAVTPQMLHKRAGRVIGSAEAIAAAYGALTTLVQAESAAGDALLAAALAEFAQAWARALPLLSSDARLHGAGLRAAADRYMETERRAAGARG